MRKAAKSRAESLFTAPRNKDQLIQEEKDRALRERAENTARLKALRLAKEAEERRIAEKDAAKKVTAKKAAPKKKKASAA